MKSFQPMVHVTAPDYEPGSPTVPDAIAEDQAKPTEIAPSPTASRAMPKWPAAGFVETKIRSWAMDWIVDLMRRKFSCELKCEAVRLVTDCGVAMA